MESQTAQAACGEATVTSNVSLVVQLTETIKPNRATCTVALSGSGRLDVRNAHRYTISCVDGDSADLRMVQHSGDIGPKRTSQIDPTNELQD